MEEDEEQVVVVEGNRKMMIEKNVSSFAAFMFPNICVAVCCRVLPCVAACCRVLRCGALCCIVV